MDPPSKGSNRNLGTYALPPEQLGTPANYGTASRREADAIDGTSFQVPRRQRASPPLLPRGSENSVMEWGSGRQIVLAPENGAAQSPRRATPTTPAAKPTPPPQPWPIFCYLTIVACAIGLAVSMYETPGVLAPLSVNPMIGPSSDALIYVGAKVACLIEPPYNQWWRLVVPMWLHAGIIHFAVNMNMLYQAGFQMERSAGPFRFATLYLLSGLLSIISSSVFAPYRVTVGASGALFGIIGAYLGELIQNCHLLTAKEACCAFASLGLTIVLNLAIGLLPLLDNFAHLGGLIGGLCLGFAVLIRVDEYGQIRLRQLITGVLGVVMYCFLLTGGILLMWYRDGGPAFCGWCQYVSCVPSPWWSCDSSTTWELGLCGANATSISP